MRVWLIVLILPFFLNAEDFISEFEYGQMLYKNPRGVSCASCHGDLGDGAFISSFIDKEGNKQKFYGPDIRSLDLKKFRYRVSRGGKIMPKYYLTNKEVEAIFKYIKIVNNYTKEKVEQSSKKGADENIPEIIVDTNYTLEDENASKNNNTILGKIFKTKEDEEEQ